MPKLTVKFSGYPEFEKNAKEVVKRLNSSDMQDRMLPAARFVRDFAKRLVSLGPGRKNKHLRDAIFATKGKRVKGSLSGIATLINGEEGPSVIVGVDRKKAPHAHLVEFGHAGPHGAPAHPYMRPAGSAARTLIITVIQNAITSILKPFTK